MTDNDFLKKTIELAQDNVSNGGWPFSSIIVKDGKIIAEAVNSVHKTNDPSDHAEIAVIRKATNKLGTPNLAGCTLYMIAPPCPMCNTCMILAKISKVVYAANIDDKDKALTSLPLTNELYETLGSGFETRSIEWQQNSNLQGKAVEVLKGWNSKNE